ncbi:MAG: hypothetical protein KDB53_19130, partial [Planctomycetes bacterium]|nr:hypothetical protein [Planctomycetota bacterium]
PKVERVGPIAGTLAVAMLLFAGFLFDGALNGRVMPYLVESLMPPALEQHDAGGALGWRNHMKDDPEGALARGKENGAPVFVDFTGYT